MTAVLVLCLVSGIFLVVLNEINIHRRSKASDGGPGDVQRSAKTTKEKRKTAHLLASSLPPGSSKRPSSNVELSTVYLDTGGDPESLDSGFVNRLSKDELSALGAYSGGGGGEGEIRSKAKAKVSFLDAEIEDFEV